MAFLGYHLIRNGSHLDRLLNVMCLVAIISPSWESPKRSSTTPVTAASPIRCTVGSVGRHPRIAAISVGGAGFRRVPSTFSFVAQYYIFMTSMVAFGYAWWRRARPDRSAAICAWRSGFCSWWRR